MSQYFPAASGGGGRAFDGNHFIYLDFELSPLPQVIPVPSHNSICIAKLGKGAVAHATYNISSGAFLTALWAMLVNNSITNNNFLFAVLVTSTEHNVGDTVIGVGSPTFDVLDALSPSTANVLPNMGMSTALKSNSQHITTNMETYNDGSYITLGQQLFYSLWIGNATAGPLTSTITELELSMLAVYAP